MPTLGELLDQPETLGALADEKKPFSFGGGRARGGPGGGGRITPLGPPEPALEEDITRPSVLVGQAFGGPVGRLLPFLRALPWLARSAVGSAATTGTAGAVTDVAEGRNPLPALPANVALGAIAGPALEGAVRLPGAIPRRAPRPVGPIMPARTAPERQPFTGISEQQQIPAMTEEFHQIVKDPGYLRRLNELGGGRVQTNPETVGLALREGPLSLEDLRSWPAERPVNAVIQTRGLITKDFHQQRYKAAIERGDAEAARVELAILSDIEPGVQNLRATPGRALQAQAMFVQDRVAQEVEKLAALHERGVPLDQISRAIAESRRALSRESRIGRLGGQIRSAIDAFETYATAAKLTSSVTHGVNSVSNVLTFLTMRPIEKVGTAANLLARREPVAALAEVQALFGTSRGLQAGIRRWGDAMFGEVPDIGKGEVARGLPLKGKARLLDPFRHLGAADAFMKGIIEDSELHQMAFLSAYQQGLRGPALAQRIVQLVNDPPPDWLARVREMGKEHTFQSDPDAVLRALLGVRHLPGSRLVVPFLSTPYNLAKYVFQRSPAGLLAPRNIAGLAKGGRESAEATGRLAVGTVFAVGAWLTAKSGEVTGAWPRDKATQDLWRAEGREPYSIRIGDRWLRYNRFQPAGAYLGQAAALNDALERGETKGVPAMFWNLAASAGRQILDQPFVAGMSSALDALHDPERSAEKFGAQTLTGVIPNILRDIRVQTDVKAREAKGLRASVLNMMPGFSQRLEPRLDVLGREIEYDPNRLLRATKVVGRSRETPETEGLRTKLEGRKAAEVFKPTGKVKTTFERELGEARVEAIRMARSQPGFEQLDLEAQADLIERAMDAATRMVRRRWRATATQ